MKYQNEWFPHVHVHYSIKITIHHVAMHMCCCKVTIGSVWSQMIFNVCKLTQCMYLCIKKIVTKHGPVSSAEKQLLLQSYF